MSEELKAEVRGWFNIGDFDGHVIFARYETPDWEGYADVVFIHNGKIYWVSDSHCSCHGLDNWEPEEMTVTAFHKIAKDGRGLPQYCSDAVLRVLAENGLADLPDDVVEEKLKAIFG